MQWLRRLSENPFYNHEWKNFDATEFAYATLKRLVIAAFVCLVLCALSALLPPPLDALWTGITVLMVTVVVHFWLRWRLDRQSPRRSFTDEAQQGSLEFLRLLPANAHYLVLARKLPSWLLRVWLAGLFVPAYALALVFFGLPAETAVPLALLLGMANWLLAATLLPCIFLMGDSPSLLVPIFLLVLAASAQGVNRLDQSSPNAVSAFVLVLAFFSTFVALMLQLVWVLGGQGAFAFFAPLPFYAAQFSPIWATFWLVVAASIVRIDRLARWLENPKGVRRFLFVLPLFLTLFILQGFLWGHLKQVRNWSPQDCLAACAAFSFAFSGVLHWFWFNWQWAEKTPPSKPPLAWLPETFAWRFVPLLVPITGLLLDKEPAGQISATFFSLWWFLSLADTFSLAVTKSLVLRRVMRGQGKGVETLAMLAFVPFVGLLLSQPALVAFSPSLALLSIGFQPLLSGWLPKVSSVLTKVSVATAAAMGLVRLVVLVVIWQWLVSGRKTQRERSQVTISLQRVWDLVWWLGEIVFVMPALERWLLAHAPNPVFRHFVQATRWRYGWLPYLAALGASLILPSAVLTWTRLALIPLLPFFWYFTYLTVHSYLRKLHQTGELWLWLITPMPNWVIVNGWRYGGWWWQARWFGLLVWFWLGGSLKELVTLSVGGQLTGPSTWFGLLLGQMVLIAGLWLLFVLAVMGAVPLAILDAFRKPKQVFGSKGHQWSHSTALLISLTMAVPSCLCVCLMTLIGIMTTIMSDKPAVSALEQVRKAPMDRLPLQGGSAV